MRAQYEVVESPGPGSHIGQFSIEEREWDPKGGNDGQGAWRHVRDVAPGGKVWLDDGYVNVVALVQAGLVRPIEVESPPVATPKSTKA